MPNYQNTKIYKLVNDSMPGKVYYGQTKSRLSDRLSQHNSVSNKCTSKELFTTPGTKIILVEHFPCNNMDEAKARERHYIENNECVNKFIPGRTQKEWTQLPKTKESRKEQRQKPEYIERMKKWGNVPENKEKIKGHKKKYAENNKEKIKEQRKIKAMCICGSNIVKRHMKEHEQSKKHKAFIASNN